LLDLRNNCCINLLLIGHKRDETNGDSLTKLTPEEETMSMYLEDDEPLVKIMLKCASRKI